MKYSAISALPLALLAASQASGQVTVYTGLPTTTDSAAAAEQTLNYAGLVSPPPIFLIWLLAAS